MAERMLRESLSRWTGREQRGWFCPDESALAAYVDGKLEGGPRVKMERHLAGCEHCLGQVSFLVRMQGEDAGVPVPAGLLARAKELGAQQAGPVFLPGWRWAAVAGVTAGLAMVIAVSLRQPEFTTPTPLPPTAPAVERAEPQGQTQPKGAPPDKVRGPAAEAPSFEVVSPREGEILSREKVSFRWRPVRGAVSYDVRVVTEEGDLVWESRTEGNRAVLPASVPLEPGRKYFVWVVAQFPGGLTLKAQAVAFRIEGSK